MKTLATVKIRAHERGVLFEDLKASKVYVFQVVSLNERGYRGSPSNPVQVYWDDPPQQPRVVIGDRAAGCRHT